MPLFGGLRKAKTTTDSSAPGAATGSGYTSDENAGGKKSNSGSGGINGNESGLDAGSGLSGSPTMGGRSPTSAKSKGKGGSGMRANYPPPQTRCSNEPLPLNWVCSFHEKSRQEFYHNKETGESQWERPAKIFMRSKGATCGITPAEVRPAPTKPKGIDRLKPEEFQYLGPFLSITAGEMRRNQIERPSWQKNPDWVTIRRETGISDEELEEIIGDERLDVCLEAWLYKWHRGKTTEEVARFFQQFELEAPFAARALCKFDPRCLIDTFSDRIGFKIPFNKEIINIICGICTVIVASRNTDDIRRQVRQAIRN